MGKVYAESAKKYSLYKSLEKAERMFADEIMDSGRTAKLKKMTLAAATNNG